MEVGHHNAIMQEEMASRIQRETIYNKLTDNADIRINVYKMAIKKFRLEISRFPTINEVRLWSSLSNRIAGQKNKQVSTQSLTTL